MVALGMIGAFALGLTVGPQITANRNLAVEPVVEAAPAPARADSIDLPAPPRAVTPQLRRVPAATAEPVQQRVKLLLNRGTDVRMAADGFANAYQLMTVAYAAKNTDIPFLVLKNRVLAERQPLAAAINEFRPELDEAADVTRARAEARADLARLRG
jgi:hypothetical protein